VSGPDVEIVASADRLEHAFLFLLLNSLRGFEATRTGRAHIGIAIDAPDGPTDHCSLTYRDTAPGFLPRGLNVPKAFADLADSQQIFEFGGASQRDPDGWELALVRQIFREHGGSIELIENRDDGVVFAMRLQTAAHSPEEAL
jgi:sensor histidine kinase regulating citrate/malate metabolism